MVLHPLICHTFKFNLSLLAQSYCMSQSLNCFASTSFFLISSLERCLMNKTMVTWHVTAAESVAVVWITKSENLWIYSCKLSFAGWVLECKMVAACIFCHRTKYLASLSQFPTLITVHTFNKLVHYTFCVSSCQFCIRMLGEFSNLLNLSYLIYERFVTLSIICLQVS